MTLQEILNKLQGVKGSGSQYYAKCPAHEDKRASLSIKQADNGRIFLNCHAGCTFKEICAALNVKPSELAGESAQYGKTQYPSIVATYKYNALDGQTLLLKHRKSDKSFQWYNPNTNKWSKQGVPDMLYRQELVPSAASVFIVEGEKDADNINRLNGSVFPFPAVSPSNGCKTAWKKEFSELLKGKNVIILPDNDKPGEEFAQRVAENLKGYAKHIFISHLKDVFPDLPEKGDISDALQKYGNEAVRSALPKLLDEKNVYSGEGEPASNKEISSMTATELSNAVLPPTKFLVSAFLPEGSSILSAPSKMGKSWFVLDLGLSLALGRDFLGFTTTKTGVLYLALEDSLTRLKGRMLSVLNGDSAPDNFHFATDISNLDEGFFDEIGNFLSKHPEVTFVIIDTLQKIRGQALPRETSYAQDYREMGAIKKFMDERGVSPYFVHHTRKMRDDSDPFNMISGTNGIMGAFDTSMTIMKEKRTDETAVLSITGRDVEMRTDIISFNKDIHRWERLGDYKTIRENQLKQEFEDSLIAKTIKTLVEESPIKRWDGTASELLKEGERITGTNISPTVKKLGHELKKFSPDLLHYGNIIMETTKHGNAGKVYHFYTNGLNGLENSCEQTSF